VVYQPNTPKCAIIETQNFQDSFEIEVFIRESCCAITEKNKKPAKKWRHEADKDIYHEKAA